MKHRLTILLLLIACYTFAEKRALVIGIGAYPDVDYGWHSINGANDIVLAIDLLLANGFSRQHITTLRNEQATYTAILLSLQTLISQAGAGDVVYIHFSGHGQQVTDLNGDEADGFDEAWVPYDALQEPTSSYNGERHLTDDELNHYLYQISQKIGSKGKLIVVSDACHSGTATRDISDTCIIRGSSAKFILARKVGTKDFQSRPIQWIAISACADNECNRQTTTADGTPCGSLTYALYLLRSELSRLSIPQLTERLTATMKPLIPRPQSPQVEIPVTYPRTTLF